jgi:hypothetical protein
MKGLKRIGQTFLPLLPQAILASVIAIVLCLEIPKSETLTSQTNLDVFVPIKAGVVGVVVAALLAFWGYFWAEIVNSTTDVDDLPYIVQAYRRTFAYLVPALLLLFVSLGFDFYLLLVNEKSSAALDDSFGTFGASLAMIMVFVLVFAYFTLSNMADLQSAGTPPKADATPPGPKPAPAPGTPAH